MQLYQSDKLFISIWSTITIMSKKESTDNIQKKCPECDSYSLIPFVYGLLSQEARIERGKKGEYAWGGCRRTQATDYCKECEASFIVSNTSIEKIESETFDEQSFLKDRGNLFKEFGINIDEESDKDLYDK
mgnify:FL=1